ncbi:podocalyxin [Xyrichtys novacula]|uniref:Podocalyxin n=1 Tax=Xyrichtys novacula TaxID=13765 RepID=A0AAV1F343_XYRNO|nr:podocalyxin [Xyrichtys novacula]
MRATPRITWLLLLLFTTSFLLHAVSASEDNQNATSVSKDDANVTAAMDVATTPVGGVQSGLAVTTKTDAPTTTIRTTHTNPATTATTPVTTATTAKPTDKPAATQPPTTTVQNNQPAAPATTSGSSNPPLNKPPNPTTTNPSPTMTPNPTATTDSSSSGGGGGGQVATTNTPKISTIKPSDGGVVPAVTDASTTQPGGQGTVETTTISKVTTSGRIPTTQTTISSGTIPQDGKGVTQKTTVTVTTPPPTTSRATQSSGTTINPFTPTKAGPPSGGTTGGKVETTAPQTTKSSMTSTVGQLRTFQKDEEKELVEVCRRLMNNLQDGNCTLTWRHHGGKVQFDCVEVNGKVKTSVATQIYEEINKKPTDNKTLIAILASCGALLIMIVILAVCASHHRKPYNENQQHLTEELHTVENGYHDNPTLEVMEVQSEMQEKKMALNGEFNDSWIVPIDNLLKDEIPDEEDTHL